VNGSTLTYSFSNLLLFKETVKEILDEFSFNLIFIIIALTRYPTKSTRQTSYTAQLHQQLEGERWVWVYGWGVWCGYLGVLVSGLVDLRVRTNQTLPPYTHTHTPSRYVMFAPKMLHNTLICRWVLILLCHAYANWQLSTFIHPHSHSHPNASRIRSMFTGDGTSCQLVNI
jgi:hypothetical protein